jgi:peptide/nickel transport system permease protein
MADWGSLVRENLGALPMGGASVLAPALAIAVLTIAVNMVIDNLPGHTDADRETH